MVTKNMSKSKSYLISKQIVPQQINSINISVPMSELTASDYHFCTLGELQSPKQLPSVDFVAKIHNICNVPMTLFESPQRNIYDRKNHILYINNYESYARALRQKYARSVASFEKQLKMMGFKKRKIKQHTIQSFNDIKFETNHEAPKLNFNDEFKQDGKIDQSKREPLGDNQQNNRMLNAPNYEIKKQKANSIKYMFVWRTNRHALIESELQSLEQTYSKQVERAIFLKQEMEKIKNSLDSKLETVIFHSLLNSSQNLFAEIHNDNSCQTIKKTQSHKNETLLDRYLKEALKSIRVLSNESQIQTKNMVKSVSQNSAKELELFRILIYKQSHIHKAIEEQ